MTRNEVVEEIKNIVLNYNVNSSIDIDSNIIYIEFGNNNKIEIEGFDSDNVYLLKNRLNKE